MSSSVSRQLSVKAKLELLLLLGVDDRDGVLKRADNSEWKYASRLACQYFENGPEPLANVTSEAVALAVKNAELLTFVEHMFLTNEPLYVPGVRPSAELVPAVVKAAQLHGIVRAHLHGAWYSLLAAYAEKTEYPEILEEVFRFAVRDGLDTDQLACRHFHKFVDARADALALRSLSEVVLSRDCAPGEGFVQIRTAPKMTERGCVFAGNGSQASMETVLSLLRNGCAQMIKHRPSPLPLLQALLSEDVRFVAKAGELRCYGNSNLESLGTSLQLMAKVGVRQFHFLMHEPKCMRLLSSEVLAGADFVSCRLMIRGLDMPALTESQQLVEDFLRTRPGKRVAILVSWYSPVVRADRIIEEFLDAEKPDGFTMPASVQFEVWQDDMPVPAQCRYPTLQNVAIPATAIVRHDAWLTTHFDVYHFQNARIKEHLTVCLGKRDDGSVSFFFIQRGRVLTSEEEIWSMEPFPYQLTD